MTRSNLLQVLATTDVSKPMNVADRIIRERLNDELEDQPWAYLLSKNIVVENGVVHLFGIVQSEEERHAIRLAAENQAGVKAVEDHLSIVPAAAYVSKRPKAAGNHRARKGAHASQICPASLLDEAGWPWNCNY